MTLRRKLRQGARAVACLATALLAGPADAQAAAQPLVHADEWQAYAGAFVTPEGRIIDDANGGISHSEGQGYGLLLAYLAGAEADFDRIWRFTLTEMKIRDDGLVAWKWDPEATPHITDVNNASDGDILIAYALALAGKDWEKPDYTAAATDLTAAIGATDLIPDPHGLLLLPGATGFAEGERDDAPVVNPSYWIFEALPVLARLDPAHDWAAVAATGAALISEIRFGTRALPPDWLSLAGEPKPAAGFSPEFGYNALRIPLYLVRAGNVDPAMLARFREGMTAGDGIAIVNLATDEVTGVLDDPGYRAVPALLACLLGEGPLPEELSTFATSHYYPSTLHLLVLSHARKELPQCL